MTLLPEGAHVEAVHGEKGSQYRAPRHLSTFVRPPTFWERLRGLTFEAKVLAELERKRRVAAEANAAPATGPPSAAPGRRTT